MISDTKGIVHVHHFPFSAPKTPRRTRMQIRFWQKWVERAKEPKQNPDEWRTNEKGTHRLL